MINSFSVPINIHRFSSLASTNQTLWELLEQGAPAGTVVVSKKQTAGRGQWGRKWESSLGGLYLSFAIKPAWEATSSSDLTRATAWGIATTFRTYDIPLQLKHPNDLFLAGRKLGGILTETRIQGGVIIAGAIGVGINWDNPVPEVGINLQSYWQQKSIKPQISDLAMLETIILEGISLGYGQLLTYGLDSFLPSYQDLLIKI